MTPISQGRLPNRTPVAIIDIGSNSVRLVIYEGISRSPSVLFNEKMLAGLGRTLVSTGKLNPEGIEHALLEFHRFKALCEQAGADRLHVLATAAAREAENGPQFIAKANEILGVEIHVLSGREEAYYSALGIISSFYQADGIAGDLGGGSLEFVDIKNGDIGDGITLPLGGLRLQEMTKGDPLRAHKLVREQISRATLLDEGRGRNFYAVGGTWRNLARLHMIENGYPLTVMHHYEMIPDQIIEFLEQIVNGDANKMIGIKRISKSRRALLPYGAANLLEIIHRMKPERIITSGYGVREGYLYSLLDEEWKRADPLLIGAGELATLRARSALHGHELAEWTGRAFQALDLDETVDERRYRKAACLLADIGWRAHPEYRGTQSFSIIANAAFIGIDHPGRAYLSLANLYRHEGLIDDEIAPDLRRIITPRLAQRSKVLGLLFRVVYLLSASMPGVMPSLHWKKTNKDVVQLVVPSSHKRLIGERPKGRLSHLAKFMGIEMEIVIGN